LIASKLDITLDNTDPTVFDDRYAGSLFYGADWYNDSVTIYDDVLDTYVWKGRLKKIAVNEQNRTLTVKTTNYIYDLATTPCVISSTSDTTPAAHSYDMLVDPNYLNIPAEDISYGGFQEAINIQAANSAYVNISFVKSDNKNCLAVITELCRLSHCHIWATDNKIYFWQWRAYAGELGAAVNEGSILAKKYSHTFDDKIIYNDYSVAYDSAGAVTFATGSNAASILKFGVKVFAVPDKEVSSVSTEVKILYKNATGATWSGAMAIDRFRDFRKIAKFTLDKKLDYVPISDQLDLNFEPFVREPVQIIGRQYDREKRTISVVAEFLNTPYQRYARDMIPPEPVELIALMPLDRGLFIKWTKSPESDHVGYHIWFTATPGMWEQEECNYGRSPIDVKNPPDTPDGYASWNIHELTNGVEYYIQISSYDNSLNESKVSNKMSGIPI
jgi:hypothetical protein